MGIKMKFIERKLYLDKLINVIGTPDIKTKQKTARICKNPTSVVL